MGGWEIGVVFPKDPKRRLFEITANVTAGKTFGCLMEFMELVVHTNIISIQVMHLLISRKLRIVIYISKCCNLQKRIQEWAHDTFTVDLMSMFMFKVHQRKQWSFP